MTERRRVRVEGIVQGVGYRPFVYVLAQRAGVTGFVGNDAEGVFAEVEGDPAAVAAFVAALRDEAPPLAVVESVTAEVVPPRGDATFVIVESRAGGEHVALISPDMATCAECLAEMADPAGRRHRYPFTNCTNCGPRFTITTSVPYDRPFTPTTAPSLSSRAVPASGSPGITCPPASTRVSVGPQAGQQMGWAWKRRSAGSWYSALQSAHISKPAMVVNGRS